MIQKLALGVVGVLLLYYYGKAQEISRPFGFRFSKEKTGR
jgi:hypothetical protein